MNIEKRIALACFIGAGLGALLALQFSHHFWWVGILIGGGAGYLSYCFKEVMAAIKTSWSMAVMHEYSSDIPRFRKWYAINHENVRNAWKNVGVAFWAWIVGTSWASIVIIPLMSVHHVGRDDYAESISLMGLLGMVISLIMAILVKETSACRLRRENMRYFTKAFPPISVCCLVLAIYHTRMELWRAGKTVARLCGSTFCLIHSDIRLLCMTDSLLGALIGYYCGNALIGGVSGAILGVMNYRFISVKLLKLVKA